MSVSTVFSSTGMGKEAPQINECYDDLDEGYYNILLAHQPEQINELLA